MFESGSNLISLHSSLPATSSTDQSGAHWKRSRFLSSKSFGLLSCAPPPPFKYFFLSLSSFPAQNRVRIKGDD